MENGWTTLKTTIGGLYDNWAPVAYTFLIVLAILVTNAVLRRVLRRLIPARGAKHVWRDALLWALGPPLRAIIWVIGLSIAVEALTQGGNMSLLAHVFAPARNVATIVIVTWFVLRVVHRAERNLLARARNRGQEVDPTAADAIGKLVRAAVFITAILVIMQTLGFSVAGILAFGGMGGIAVGFAAQSLVANLLGGLTIFASRPFKVGEYIILPGTELMGGVEHIGWRATRILGFDEKPFFVPNAVFNTSSVINHSRMHSRRIMEYMYIRYRDVDRVQAVVADANKMLNEHPGIRHDFFIFRFDSCGDHALKLFLYAFTVSTDYTDYMVVKEDILLKIAGIVREHGAELAVPVSNVYMPEGLQLKSERDQFPEEPLAAGLSHQRETSS